MELDGKAAVITGGGGGIGTATGVRMGRAGARVLLVDLDATRLHAAAEAVAATGARVRMHVADVTSSAAARSSPRATGWSRSTTASRLPQRGAGGPR